MAQDSVNPKGDFPILPNEFAWIMSKESGKIKTAVGPIKVQIGQNEEIVEFNEDTKTFEVLNERRAQKLKVIPKGWYAVLTNPAAETRGQPNPGETQEIDPKQLQVGIKVVISGEKSFALWPGQMIKIVEGHTLKSNECLLCRVYDEDAARKYVAQAVIKTVDIASEPKEVGKEAKEESKSEVAPVQKKEDKPSIDPVKEIISKATTGQRIIIKGKDISFFIPPTGIEVLKENGSYVRQAVTLEELEYCVLVSERGTKRFCYGPAIVFPEADESFMTSIENARKFRALDLNEISGIYVKVIRSYKDKDKDGKEKEFKEGEELFITGKDQPFYFPRPEHTLISYGKSPVHFAVAVPKGDGRYVLGRMTSNIRTERGPKMLLLDPRVDVAVRRVLTPAQVRLWFPGNFEAEKVNAELRKFKETDAAFVTERTLKAKGMKGVGVEKSLESSARNLVMAMAEPVSDSYGGEEISRKPTFTAPLTVTIDTKYEGPVKIVVWSGYAVLVKDSGGKRRVVKGPQPIILEYDEEPEVLRLSTGKPKNTDQLLETIYLLTTANKVSDIIEVETSDFCTVSLKLSYRVNFEGEPEKWWNVENYVKLLCDHLRSLLKNMAKHHAIEDFYANAIDLIRDAILGKAEVKAEGKPESKAERPGRVFTENDMKVYDVEVLGVEIQDNQISDALRAAQSEAVDATIQKKRLEIALEKTRQTQEVERAKAEEINNTKLAGYDLQNKENAARAETTKQSLALEVEKAKQQLEVNLARVTSEIEEANQKRQAELAKQVDLDKINTAQLVREKAKEDQELILAKEKMAQRLEELKAEVQAVVEKAKAISPELIAALEAFGDKELAQKMAESMAPLAILGGKSVADTLAQLLKGTALEDVVKKLGANKEEPRR